MEPHGKKEPLDWSPQLLKEFVYKEVRGKELEQATQDGWEFVGNGAADVGYTGIHSTYLVRRPKEKPSELALNELLRTTNYSNARFRKVFEESCAHLREISDDLKALEESKSTKEEMIRTIRRLRTHGTEELYRRIYNSLNGTDQEKKKPVSLEEIANGYDEERRRDR